MKSREGIKGGQARHHSGQIRRSTNNDFVQRSSGIFSSFADSLAWNILFDQSMSDSFPVETSLLNQIINHQKELFAPAVDVFPPDILAVCAALSSSASFSSSSSLSSSSISSCFHEFERQSQQLSSEIAATERELQALRQSQPGISISPSEDTAPAFQQLLHDVHNLSTTCDSFLKSFQEIAPWLHCPVPPSAGLDVRLTQVCEKEREMTTLSFPDGSSAERSSQSSTLRLSSGFTSNQRLRN